MARKRQAAASTNSATVNDVATVVASPGGEQATKVAAVLDTHIESEDTAARLEALLAYIDAVSHGSTFTFQAYMAARTATELSVSAVIAAMQGELNLEDSELVNHLAQILDAGYGVTTAVTEIPAVLQQMLQPPAPEPEPEPEPAPAPVTPTKAAPARPSRASRQVSRLNQRVAYVDQPGQPPLRGVIIAESGGVVSIRFDDSTTLDGIAAASAEPIVSQVVPFVLPPAEFQAFTAALAGGKNRQVPDGNPLAGYFTVNSPHGDIHAGVVNNDPPYVDMYVELADGNMVEFAIGNVDVLSSTVYAVLPDGTDLAVTLTSA